MRLPKYSWIAGLAILALPTTALSTQQRYDDPRTDATTTQRASTRTSTQDRDLANSPHLCKFSKLSEKELKGANNEEIGKIEDLVVNLSTGQPEYAAISTGGILGIGGDTYAVPVRDLNYNRQTGEMSLSMSQQELENHYKLEDRWPASFEGNRAVGDVDQSRDVVRLSKLTEWDVRDQQGQEVGSIEEIVFNAQQGKIEYVVIDHTRAGGNYAVPLQALQPRPDGEGVVIQGSQQDFRREENITAGNWPVTATTLVVFARPQYGEQQYGQRSQWEQESRQASGQDPWRQDSQRYGQDSQRSSQDTWSQRQDEQRYGQDSQRYGRDSQRYGQDEQRYGQDQQRYGQDSWRTSQDQQRYGQDQQRYGQDSWGQDSMMGRQSQDMGLHTALESAQSKTVRGEVQSVRQEGNLSVAQVRTQDGETLMVVLAPQDFLRQEGLQIREGEQISLTGKQLFVPTRLQFDNRTVQLRDAQGQPRWQQDRMDFGSGRQAREAGFGRTSQQDALAQYLSYGEAEEVTGEVGSVDRRRIRQEEFLVVQLRDARGSTRDVALLPANQISARDIGVSSGDQLTVEACQAHIDGREIWVAKSVEANGRTMRLRDGNDPNRSGQYYGGDQRYDSRNQQQGWGNQQRNWEGEEQPDRPRGFYYPQDRERNQQNEQRYGGQPYSGNNDYYDDND